MSVKTDTENKKGALVFGQLPQTSAQEAAELEASCLKEAWSKKAWEDALEDKSVVMRARGWMAGGRLLRTWQSFEDADICNVAVDQTLRRQGIGEQLLLFLMENGKKRGVKNFTLEVRRSNEAAIGLYHKLGFLDEGVRPNFYDSPKEAALILWKKQETQG